MTGSCHLRALGRLSASALLLLLLVTLPARAGSPPLDDATRNAARELARDGVAAYDAGEYEKALDLLRRAHALVPAPTITIFEARCLSRLGRLVEAMERYEATRRAELEKGAPPAFREAVKDAARELEEVRERVPKLKIVVTGPGADSRFLKVRLDGKPVPPALIGVPRTVDPGTHRIEARVPGVSRGVTRLSIEEKAVEETQVRLLLTSQGEMSDESAEDGVRERKPSDATTTWGWVALGVGVTGVAVGATGALVARGKESDLEAACDGSTCPASARSDLDSFRSARTLAFVGYGVGAVGLISGAVLLMLPSSSGGKESAHVVPRIGMGSVGVEGTF